MNRRRIHDRFRDVCERGELLIGAAVGSGLFAEAAEKGGADFIFVLSVGRLRLMGAASAACMLPICDSNAVVSEFGTREFVDRCSIPVIFGASVMIPSQSAAEIAGSIAALGFAGVTNYPSVVHFPPAVSSALDSCGLGFHKELDLLAAARELDLWTVCWVRTREQAQQAAAAGVDMVCFDYGWTTGGWHGMASRLTLKEAVMIAREVATAVQRENNEIMLVVWWAGRSKRSRIYCRSAAPKLSPAALSVPADPRVAWQSYRAARIPDAPGSIAQHRACGRGHCSAAAHERGHANRTSGNRARCHSRCTVAAWLSSRPQRPISGDIAPNAVQQDQALPPARVKP